MAIQLLKYKFSNDDTRRHIHCNEFSVDNTKDDAFLIAGFVSLIVVFVAYAFHSPRKVFSIFKGVLTIPPLIIF